ncbi:hypothetical protein J008_06257 [Cryptococcus neoformans]|nr:hypothetical protein J008_06257 [Cryptococcus neoformans var. grubii]
MTDHVSSLQQDGVQYGFFFYGTLCVPAVLAKVLGHKCENITFQDALLPGYTRHKVKNEMYPAVIDKALTKQLLKDDPPNASGVNTRGTYVKGFSHADLHAIDMFEGEEYSRLRLPIQIFSRPANIQKLPAELVNPMARKGPTSESSAVEDEPVDAEKNMVEGWVYVWAGSLERLVPQIWRFEAFIRAKESEWNDLPEDWFTRLLPDGELQSLAVEKEELQDEEEIEDGDQSKLKGRTAEGFENFGKEMLRHWAFRPGYINLNHGSYGSPPRHVLSYMRDLSEEIESCPDLFLRRTYLPLLNETRQKVADIIGAEQTEVVLVPNTTHGVFNVLENIKWDEGDVIVVFSTTYGAVAQMAKRFADVLPISLHIVPLTFPCTHAKILTATEDVLAQYNKEAIPNYTGQSRAEGKEGNHQRVRAVLCDVLASMPGVLYPWEKVVTLCKKYGALSIIDGAHAIGQIPLDIKKADCDFFVSNCHKWLMAHRGVAFLYVPTRNQYLMRTSVPTSAGYESSKYPTLGGVRSWDWASQYEWTGTQNWTPLFSVLPAIEFRKSIGGEQRIMDYCQSLAIEGGKRLKKKWGPLTCIMDTKPASLTVAMVNLSLPHVPAPNDAADQAKQLRYFEEGMYEANCFAACYVHGGKWWLRLSAQVWNDLSDFEYVGEVLEKLCLEIKNDKYNEQESVTPVSDAPKQDE